MEPAFTYSAGSRKGRLEAKFVWGLSATSKSHQLAKQRGKFCGFVKQVSSMHLLVTSHPQAKTSLHLSKHSFSSKQFHLPFTQQQDKGEKRCGFPELKAKLQALFTWHYKHFLAVS